jgi:hypothetical protein
MKVLKECQYELEFKELFSPLVKRKQINESNKIKAYTGEDQQNECE